MRGFLGESGISYIDLCDYDVIDESTMALLEVSV
jgi:hypothetical protein